MKLTNLPSYELGQVSLPPLPDVILTWLENGDVVIGNATDEQVRLIQTAIYTAAGGSYLATWQAEQAILDAIQAEAEAFEGLPDWAAYTAAEAVAAIHDAIFAGATLATVQAQIDALPATIAGMKTGLKSAAAEIITTRNLLEKMAKAIVYLRDRT